MGSHQLITVPDYNRTKITSNNPKGVFWSNYSAWLNKMADTWWFEETKLLIKVHQCSLLGLLQTVLTTVWSTSSNRKAKTKVSACLTKSCLIHCCCFRRRIFVLLVFEASFAFLLASKSSIVKYHGSCSIEHHFVFNFRLRGYPA